MDDGDRDRDRDRLCPHCGIVTAPGAADEHGYCLDRRACADDAGRIAEAARDLLIAGCGLLCRLSETDGPGWHEWGDTRALIEVVARAMGDTPGRVIALSEGREFATIREAP